MSADMMFISKEDDSNFEGKGTDKAFCVDETSMGEPHTNFGKYIGERFCGAPGIMEQLAGIHGHTYITLTEPDIEAIKKSFDSMEHKDYVDRDKLFQWLDEHEGKHISTENW